MKVLRSYLTSPTVFRILTVLAFVCFVILLNWIIIFKISSELILTDSFDGMIEKPFKERFMLGAIPFIFSKDALNYLTDFLLNIIIFIPFGILFPTLTKKRTFFRFLLVAFLISLTFEIFQLITLWGQFDVDDLISNSLGFIVGYLFYLFILKDMKKSTVTALYTIAIVIAIPVSLALRKVKTRI
jgi:glycopeptide antibiotics resistance protein